MIDVAVCARWLWLLKSPLEEEIVDRRGTAEADIGLLFFEEDEGLSPAALLLLLETSSLCPSLCWPISPEKLLVPTKEGAVQLKLKLPYIPPAGADAK